MRSLSVVCALALLACGSAALAHPNRILNRRVEPSQTLAHALHAALLPDAQVEAIVGALQGVFDFHHVRPGDQFRIALRNGELDFFDYRQGGLDEWQVRRDGDLFVGSKRAIEVERRVVTAELNVESSLYEAAVAAGESPEIAMALSDVFAWEIDFYQDVRKGDRVRAVLEKFISKGRVVRYGEVLAAAYTGEAVGRKRVFRYELGDGTFSYFQQDGSSARKSFLKSPLKYAHVTSRFGRRLHPLLQFVKDHNGVDYGAAIGTPVWAVADGAVTRAGWEGSSGKLVCIRHANGFETCYAHLSSVGVRTGQRVSQMQVIAYSGNTGRSTGPHLHYALKRGGHFVNPLNQNFPRSEPLPSAQLAEFQVKIAPLSEQLDAAAVAAVGISGR
jgi:murein DD-endopeptidase MepM/ murein hydrolase activator NlpD